MRHPLPLLSLGLAGLLLAGCGDDQLKPPTDSIEDQAAFILGHNIGQGIHDQITDLEGRDTRIDKEAVLAGFRAGLRGDTLQFTAVEVQSIMTAFEEGIMQRASAAGRAEGDAFIAEYERQEGVITTASGLRYRVLEEGHGESPTANDVVTIHYEGRLPDGEVFDSSHLRGQPATLPVQGVVPGFAEALQLMRTGGRYEIVLPPELAYGEHGPPAIGPNRTLIFTVELIAVERGS